MNPTFRKVIIVLSIGLLVISGIYTGTLWIQRNQFEQRVLSAIQEQYDGKRIKLLADLRNTEPNETVGVLMEMMESSDPAMRRRAARALSLFKDHLSHHINMLIKHLQTDSEPRVRLSCAIMLMGVRRPEVDQAYIHALKDTEEKVVEIALMELGSSKSPASTEAIFTTLQHRSWRVRLEACKALITSGAADDRVTSTLEGMKQEPEAKVYDEEIADFDRAEKEIARAGDPPIAHWGNLESIIDRARSVAANHHQ